MKKNYSIGKAIGTALPALFLILGPYQGANAQEQSQDNVLSNQDNKIMMYDGFSGEGIESKVNGAYHAPEFDYGSTMNTPKFTLLSVYEFKNELKKEIDNTLYATKEE